MTFTTSETPDHSHGLPVVKRHELAPSDLERAKRGESFGIPLEMTSVEITESGEVLETYSQPRGDDG